MSLDSAKTLSSVLARKSRIQELFRQFFGNIYILLGSVFFLRVILLFAVGKPRNSASWFSWITTNDTDLYIEFANQIFNGAVTTLPFRLPLYPLYLIPTRNLFPVEWLGTILIQQAVAVFIAWLLYRIALRYAKPYALAAPLLFLFEPASFTISYTIMPETFMLLFQVLSTVFILKAASAAPARKVLFVLISSLLLVAGVFCKPILLYSFIIFIIFILTYFDDVFRKRVLFAVLFLVVFQAPVHLYRQHISRQFGVYALTRQEFSEKAARSIDIKFIADSGKIVHPSFISKELKRTLLSYGYDDKHPDYVLYARVNDSITRANIRKYPWQMVYHSFRGNYLFFQPATRMTIDFFRVKNDTILTKAADFDQYASHLKNRLRTVRYLPVVLYSVFFSIVLLIPFIALIHGNIRKLFSPLVCLSFSWFFYTAVMCGRISYARYRITFAWLFVILLGCIFSYIKENGLKSLLPPFLRRGRA